MVLTCPDLNTDNEGGEKSLPALQVIDPGTQDLFSCFCVAQNNKCSEHLLHREIIQEYLFRLGRKVKILPSPNRQTSFQHFTLNASQSF